MVGTLLFISDDEKGHEEKKRNDGEGGRSGSGWRRIINERWRKKIEEKEKTING